MPHIDPHTGCEVISAFELFAHEDDTRGVPRGTALQEFNESWAAETTIWEAQHWDPGFIFDLLRSEAEDQRRYWAENLGQPLAIAELAAGRPLPSWADDWYGYWLADDNRRPPLPVKVILVLAADAAMTFKSSRAAGRALVRADDGREYIMSYSSNDYAGGWDCPPDHECELTWEPYVPLSEGGLPEPERSEAEVMAAFRRALIVTFRDRQREIYF